MRRAAKWVFAAVATIAALAAGGGCGDRRDPNRPKTSCEGFAASEDRSALAYLDGDQLMVRTAQGTRGYPRPACMKEKYPSALFVAPGGTAVAAFAQKDNIDFDLWGHAGKHTTMACVVELGSGAERELDTAKSLSWIGGVAQAIPDENLPVPRGDCRAGSSREETWVSCVKWERSSATVVVRRYRGAELAIAGEDRVVAPDALVGGDFSAGRYAISPDGRRLVAWGKKLAVIDLASGQVTATLEELGKVSAVEFDPAGGPRLLVIGEPPGAGEGASWYARLVGLDGRVLGELGRVDVGKRVFWTEPAWYWVTDVCSGARKPVGG